MGNPVDGGFEPHHFHSVTEFLFFFCDDEVEDVDEYDHFRAEEEDGAEVLDDGVGDGFGGDEGPVFEGYVEGRRLVVEE